MRLRDLFFGPPPTPPPDAVPELAASGLLGFGRAPGHTVELLSVTPHGGDVHLVTATVDGHPFHNYIPTGDIRGEAPAVQRRIIARRVRARAKPPAGPGPDLAGREVGLP